MFVPGPICIFLDWLPKHSPTSQSHFYSEKLRPLAYWNPLFYRWENLLPWKAGDFSRAIQPVRGPCMGQATIPKTLCTAPQCSLKTTLLRQPQSSLLLYRRACWGPEGPVPSEMLPHLQGYLHYTMLSLHKKKTLGSAVVKVMGLPQPHTHTNFIMIRSLLQAPHTFPQMLVYPSFVPKKLSASCSGAGLPGPCAGWTPSAGSIFMGSSWVTQECSEATLGPHERVFLCSNSSHT